MSTQVLDKYIRSEKHSETLLINQISHQRAKQSKSIFHFGFGQSPFPIPTKIYSSLSAFADKKHYSSVQGELPLREAVCEFHRHFENKSWHPEQIIIGAGSKILIFSIMAAFAELEVLVPAPSWVSYQPQAKLLGHKFSQIQTNFDDQWRLTPEQLDQFCNARKSKAPLLLIFNYPSNPTGLTYSKDKLEKLAFVMRKHNVLVIADEIYNLLEYDNSQATLDQFYPESCIVTSGLSKWCGAGGWRLGFTHIPKQLGEKLKMSIIGVASETYSCAPTPIQYAAEVAYREKQLASDFLKQQTRILSYIGTYCSNKLQNISVRVIIPQGGFYIFPDFSHYRSKLEQHGITTSEQLACHLLNRTGVALLPGSAFGMPESSLTARLAFVDFDGSQTCQNMKNFNFDRVKGGIKALCTFLISL